MSNLFIKLWKDYIMILKINEEEIVEQAGGVEYVE